MLRSFALAMCASILVGCAAQPQALQPTVLPTALVRQPTPAPIVVAAVIPTVAPEPPTPELPTPEPPTNTPEPPTPEPPTPEPPTNTPEPPTPEPPTNTPQPPAPAPRSATDPLEQYRLWIEEARALHPYAESTEQMWAVMLCESGGQPEASNGVNHGLFQYASETWAGSWNAYRDQPITDPRAQIFATASAWNLGYQSWWGCYGRS